MMALPGAVAADKPLRLGSTMLDTAGEEGYYTLKLDFQPESLQQAQHADLLLFGEAKVKLVPLLPESGEPGPCHFDGSLEQLQQRPGGDVECVAYFDGSEWTLQLVQGHLRAKHRPGAPRVPGYNVDVPDDMYQPSSNVAAEEVDLAAAQQQMGAASIHQQGHTHSAASAAAVHTEQEIDPDLDDALEEALFAADRPSSSAQPSPPAQETHSTAQAATAPALQPPPAGKSPVQHPQQQHQQQQQQHPAQHRSHQQQQPPAQLPRQPTAPPQHQQHQHQQQQHQPPQVHEARTDAAEEEEEDSADESDDPWDTFDASAAPAPAPTAPKPAVPPIAVHQPHRHLTPVFAGGSALPQHKNTQQVPAPTAAAAAAPAAVQPTGVAAAAARGSSRGPVSVLGGDDDEEEEAGPGVQECSEDESDGVGVEYF